MYPHKVWQLKECCLMGKVSEERHCRSGNSLQSTWTVLLEGWGTPAWSPWRSRRDWGWWKECRGSAPGSSLIAHDGFSKILKTNVTIGRLIVLTFGKNGFLSLLSEQKLVAPPGCSTATRVLPKPQVADWARELILCATLLVPVAPQVFSWYSSKLWRENTVISTISPTRKVRHSGIPWCDCHRDREGKSQNATQLCCLGVGNLRLLKNIQLILLGFYWVVHIEDEL